MEQESREQPSGQRSGESRRLASLPVDAERRLGDRRRVPGWTQLLAAVLKTASIVAFAFAVSGGTARAADVAMTAAMNDSHGRFYGKPDLTLTSSMLAAGGGATAFDSTRLLGMLTAQHRSNEMARLTTRFGSARVARFAATFDAFVALAVSDAAAHNVALPAPQYALQRNSYVLAAALRRSGVMPDGRYDVGYMLEHLLSRPMHVRLMNGADAAPSVGPQANADFHVLLTSTMDDLKQLYRLPQ